MNATRWLLVFCLTLGLGMTLPAKTLLAAAEQTVNDPVQVATRDAIQNLVEEIARTPVSRNFTMGDVLQRIGGYPALNKVLQGAEQVGGPRWLDSRTCQIQLQISGTRISAGLQRIASSHLTELPVTLGEFDRALREWEGRALMATGTARLVKPAITVGPRIGGANADWPGVARSERERTIAAARLDAAQRSLRSVSPVVLTAKSTVGDVLAVRDLGTEMTQWMVERPLESVELRPELEAEITLKVTPVEVFDQFKGLAVKQKDVAIPEDEKGWSKVQTEFAQRMAAPVGRAMLMEPREAGFARRPLGIRAGHRPDWIEKRVEAAAEARVERSKLQSARAAESAAEKKLLTGLMALPFKGGQTLGEACRDNARLNDAVQRAVSRARIGKTEYYPDGSARVSVYLDLSDLWTEVKAVD